MKITIETTPTELAELIFNLVDCDVEIDDDDGDDEDEEDEEEFEAEMSNAVINALYKVFHKKKAP